MEGFIVQFLQFCKMKSSDSWLVCAFQVLVRAKLKCGLSVENLKEEQHKKREQGYFNGEKNTAKRDEL